MIKGICRECGKELSRHRGGSSSHDAGMFCCRKCSDTYKRRMWKLKKDAEALKNKPAPVVCAMCGKKFIPKRRGIKYCSKECKDEAGRTRARHYSHEHYSFISKEVRCRQCGNIFLTKYKGDKFFCSEACRKESIKEKRKAGKYNRKKRIRTVVVDKDITLEKLAKRDKDTCKICGDKVDWNDYECENDVFIAGNAYPSIDHIKPIAKGGKHAWSNIQLAHRICNIDKGIIYGNG